MEGKADLQTILQKIFTDSYDKFEKHPNATCEGCKAKNFAGYRYMCLTCDNLDLCEECYEDDVTPQNHKNNHLCLLIMKNLTVEEAQILKDALKDINQTVNQLKGVSFYGSSCNGCQMNKNSETDYINGPLIKCDECFNYKLCWECYQQGIVTEKHSLEHKVIANLIAFRKEFNVATDLFEERTLLGKGKFGAVYEAKLKSNNKVVALKSLLSNQKNKVNEKTFFAELQAYSEIISSKILRYYGYCIEDKINEKIYYILTELMCNGTLQDYLQGPNKKPLPSFRRRFQWMMELIRGIRRIHRKGFVHKDIKPDNILLNNVGSIKIGDMGVACNDKDADGFFKEYIAPRHYSAPEIVRLEPFTEAADIFSFGLVLNYIYSGKEHKRPFDVELEFPKKSEFFSELIQKCTAEKQEDRPSAKDICEWFKAFEKFFLEKVNMKKFKDFKEEEKNFVFWDVHKKAKESGNFDFL